jgi:hypothetical protein
MFRHLHFPLHVNLLAPCDAATKYKLYKFSKK